MSEETTPVQQAVQAMSAGTLLLRRWFGCWIDLLVLAALFFVPVFIVFGVSGTSSNSPYAPAAIVLGLILALAYFPVTEGIWGRSLGKLASGLKVVDKDGRTPAIWRIIVRTLMRLIEVNPGLLGGIPAGIAVLASKHRQRLGDMMAGTYVIGVSELEEALRSDKVADNFS